MDFRVRRDDPALRESIHFNYINVSDMIKFAETKNAAIVASAGAIITLIFDKLDFADFAAAMFSCGYLFMVGALITSFWAIYPIYPIYRYEAGKPSFLNTLRSRILIYRSREREVTPEPAKLHQNLVVFSDIASFPTYEAFESAIDGKYYGGEGFSAIERDILLSIYTSANIALRKFHLFKRALILFLFGGTLIVLFGPLTHLG